MERRLGYARSAAFLATAALIAASASPACREPTQVTVELRTVGGLTCAGLLGVAIVVAASPERAEEKLGIGTLSAEVPRGRCGSDPKLVGTLVVTPSAGAAAIVVRARISDAPEATCRAPDYRGCIVSRRAFAFIEHASVTLPISLEIGCLDVPCDVVTSCRTGRCVSSKAECSESSSRCESEAEPVVGPDDGGIVDDAAADATADSPTPDGPLADAGDAADAADPALNTRTNDCPTPTGKMDCQTVNGGAAPLCCMIQSQDYTCKTAGTCPSIYPRYNCVGAKNCPMTSICCKVARPPPAASNDCAPACVDQILCGSKADCPMGKECTGTLVGSMVSTGDSLHFCEPYP